jgi:hypothetical protein
VAVDEAQVSATSRYDEVVVHEVSDSFAVVFGSVSCRAANLAWRGLESACGMEMAIWLLETHDCDSFPFSVQSCARDVFLVTAAAAC